MVSPLKLCYKTTPKYFTTSLDPIFVSLHDILKFDCDLSLYLEPKGEAIHPPTGSVSKIQLMIYSKNSFTIVKVRQVCIIIAKVTMLLTIFICVYIDYIQRLNLMEILQKFGQMNHKTAGRFEL